MMHSSSREIFEKLIMENGKERFGKCPLAVRLAMRRWVFVKYAQITDDKLTSDERELIKQNPDFLAHVKQSLNILATDKIRMRAGLGMALYWLDEEEQGKRCTIQGLPWFFYLPKSELAKRYKSEETIEEERQHGSLLPPSTFENLRKESPLFQLLNSFTYPHDKPVFNFAQI